ncbi:neural cell adhesion molecule 1-B-like [Toxotes jaculatrix]|uniref:neural cell adhesion molecule 1-B-like n=1 Tax=Toxotes jaculatrix TaxID=941984 RepID=UPI001B3AE014|nr:neural cell adhesion molecule 1-B-like [Toxotes jaculatrix]
MCRNKSRQEPLRGAGTGEPEGRTRTGASTRKRNTGNKPIKVDLQQNGEKNRRLYTAGRGRGPFAAGCCVGQDILPEGPVEAVLRKNVTFKTLVDLKDNFITFVWSFNLGNELVPIVTVTPTGETVAEGYTGRVLVNRTNGFLALGPVRARDRGYYYATMVTSIKMTTAETMLRVLGCCELYALPEGPVDAVLGKNVTFKTLIDPKEELIDIAWFFNSGSELIRVVTASQEWKSIVLEGYRGRVTVNRTNGFLTLGPLAANDNGEYYANILTAKGLKTGETKLQVLEPVSGVSIRAKEFNSTVVLTCSAEGSFIKFSWINDTTPIVADETRLSIKEDGTTSTLTICGIQTSDLVGPIYCTAGNHLEVEKSAPFNLTAIFPPLSSALITQPSVAPGLTASVQPDHVREGQNVTLTCDTSHKLPRQTPVVWFRNGQPVARPPRFQAGAEDAGNYTCAVEGQESVHSNAVFLDVHYAPVNVSVEVSLTGGLPEGSTVNLTCSSAANPAADRYSWYRRTASSDLLQVGSGQVLSLPSLELSHAGLYVCQAGNPLGENSSTEVLLEVDVSETAPDPADLSEKDEEGGELTTSSQVTTSSHATVSPYSAPSSHAMTPSRTIMSPFTTKPSHVTTSPYATTSSQSATTQKDRDTGLDYQDFLDIHRAWFDKLQVEMMEMRLSFERSLRQMESRTHSLLWSMSRRLERMAEVMGHNSAPSHHKTFVSLNRLLPSGISAVTPSSQPPGSRPLNLHIKSQRTRAGRKGKRS